MKGTKKTRRDARKLHRGCLVNGALDERCARRVVRGLAASRTRGSLAVLSAFHRLVQLEHDRRTARVESATPLDAVLREGITTDLRRRYGAGVITAFTENQALLGGVRITIGSDIYDGSVSGRLAALGTRL